MEEKCCDSINSFTLNGAHPTSGVAVSAVESVNDCSLLEQPSTSSASSSSMSLLQEEFVNSNDFAEVLDDETTTSGVLETFEISSSNSLPTCSDARADAAADDSSSTDTIKLVEASEGTSCNNEYFNVADVLYVINDDDDDEDEIDENNSTAVERQATAVRTVQADNSNSNSNSGDVVNRKQLRMSTTSTGSQLGNQINSVIVTNDGATIYLETPVIEEQQHHQQLINHIVGGQSEFAEKSGKPKRLSDEFMLTDDGDQNVQVDRSSDNKTVRCNASAECGESPELGEHADTVIVDDIIECNTAELLPDRMSFRLRKMNINNGSTTSQRDCESRKNLPSSSKCSPNELALLAPSMADIESMDLIERRDFETEQRLTGGIILKSSTLINKNMLNLSLIKPCMQQQNSGQPDPLETEDDCPSSSSNSNSNSNNSGIVVGRAVSSDSKCAYKDPATTPTSSRNYNSRLTKSTAKLNLCSTLSQPHQLQNQKPQQARASKNSNIKMPLSSSSTATSTSSTSLSSSSLPSSSVIVEAPSTSGSLGSSNSSCTMGTGTAEVYSNSNSNDSLMGGNAVAHIANCQQDNHRQQQVVAVSKPEEGGCSRTSSIHAAVAEAESNAAIYDDAQPSTSSGRCQYASSTKSMRQVHASAQTNERYLSRNAAGLGAGNVVSIGSAAAVSSGGGLFHISSKNRRRAELTASASSSDEVMTAIKMMTEAAAAAAAAAELNDESSWADCEENNSDVEEICTCHQSSSSGSDSSLGGSNSSLNETEDVDASCIVGGKDGDLSNYIQMVSISEETAGNTNDCVSACPLSNIQQRKRKYNEGHAMDNDAGTAVSSSSTGLDDVNSRKRIAYDYASTPCSSQVSGVPLGMPSTPTSSQLAAVASCTPPGRRTPRSVIPTRENPQPELQNWLSQFQQWTNVERLLAITRLIEHCEPTQVRYMMKVIEPQFQRDFISLLPRELALQVLAYLEPKDLLRAAQTCRSWRFLCDDNLLWKEKCRKAQILTEPRTDRPKRGRAGNMPPIASPWKAAYMRQHIIEMNWRSRPIREPKVLRGHDDHVITCLQFSGNRIVSGSDDNTLKVWSAVSGRCLRTLVGHTGGVWSSQMSGNIIISGSTDRTLKVWDMDTGQCLHTLLGHTSTVRCMHLHGNKVVSGSRDATLRVWDIEQGTCLHVLVGHLAAVRCVQYDGKLIVSGAYDYMVKIWHPERQECLHTLSGHTNRVYSLQFDGAHVVSGSLDTSIRVWDVETGNCKHTLMGHQSLTSGMELRQNILVSGNADSTVKVWDITTGQCLQTLSGPNKHQSAVTCLQFNSRFVVTSSDDGTVKLWDVKTGEFIRNLVALESGGSGGVVWRIRANDTKLICAVGSRNGTEETKLMVLDFDVEGACVKCS